MGGSDIDPAIKQAGFGEKPELEVFDKKDIEENHICRKLSVSVDLRIVRLKNGQWRVVGAKKVFVTGNLKHCPFCGQVLPPKQPSPSTEELKKVFIGKKVWSFDPQNGLILKVAP